MKNSKKNLLLFAGLLIFAGILHIIEHTIHDISALDDPHYEVVTLFFCLEFVIYTLLIIFWIQSVYTRLLPSRARSYMVAVAVFMIFYLILRAYKYRIAGVDAGIRLSWYAYYIPMTVITALFLMVCIYIHRGATKPKVDERLFIIPAVALSGIIITNDIHYLVFVPESGLDNFIGKSGTYTYGTPFYLAYAWIILAVVSGVILLIKTFGLRQKRRLLYLVGILAIWLILTQLHTLKKYVEFTPPYESPELYIFTALAIFEFAIRQRLIPYNENYSGFFESLPMTVMITDEAYNPVYQSAVSLKLGSDVLAEALRNPIYPIPDGRLSGRKIRGGYTFWIEDESDIRHANEELNEANELLEGENTLIEYATIGDKVINVRMAGFAYNSDYSGAILSSIKVKEGSDTEATTEAVSDDEATTEAKNNTIASDPTYGKSNADATGYVTLEVLKETYKWYKSAGAGLTYEDFRDHFGCDGAKWEEVWKDDRHCYKWRTEDGDFFNISFNVKEDTITPNNSFFWA